MQKLILVRLIMFNMVLYGQLEHNNQEPGQRGVQRKFKDMY